MKRFFCVLLALCLLLEGCGSRETASGQEETAFYYVVREAEELKSESAVAPERRSVGDLSLPEFLELYFRGPEAEELASPFPAGTEALAVVETEEGLEVVLSSAFFVLRGVDLSMACCCLSCTLTAYTGLEWVVISDELGRIRLELDPAGYLLQNDYAEDTGTVFTLYFPVSSRRYLSQETREATLSDNESREAYLLRQLLAGPKSGELLPVMPEGTELLSAETEAGVCTLNLSAAFYRLSGSSEYEAYTRIYSVVNTLTELEDVTSVLFLKEGAAVGRFGVLSLKEPVTRYAGVIGPVRAGGGEMDVDVFVLREKEGSPFAVPVRVKQSIQEPAAEAVARTAIAFEPPQGFYNPIPYGTELLSISLSGSVCYADLSRRFIPAEDTRENEEAAVWALAAALLGLDTISSLVLTIEGDSGGLSFVDISEPITADSPLLRAGAPIGF